MTIDNPIKDVLNRLNINEEDLLKLVKIDHLIKEIDEIVSSIHCNESDKIDIDSVKNCLSLVSTLVAKIIILKKNR